MIHLPVKLLAVGHIKHGPEYDLFQKYKERLTHFEVIELKQSTKDAEEKLFLKHIKDGDYVIGLDEKGNDMSSARFAANLSSQLRTYKTLCFLIGGADGLSESMRMRTNFLVSFGKMTWPHMLVRGLLAEQIYRATLILNNHPYHRE